MILEMPFIHAEKTTGSLLGIQSNNAATTKQINFRLIRIKTSFGVERKMKRYYHYRPFRHSYKSSHLSWVQMEQDSTQRYRVQLSNSDSLKVNLEPLCLWVRPILSAVLLNTVTAARWAIMIPVFTLIQATPPPPPSQNRRQRKVAGFLLVLVIYSDWKAGSWVSFVKVSQQAKQPWQRCVCWGTESGRTMKQSCPLTTNRWACKHVPYNCMLHLPQFVFGGRLMQSAPDSTCKYWNGSFERFTVKVDVWL